MLLLDVGELEAVVLLAVDSLEEEAHQQSDDPEAGEDKHSQRIVLGLTFGYPLIDGVKDATDDDGHRHQTYVLDPEDS